MPINNAALYGINKGAAQIIDTTSDAEKQFANLLAKKQLQRQQELKALADQQTKLNPDGLRNDADRKDFFDQAANWRTKSIAAMNERDPYKRSLAQSEAQKSYMQAQDLVSRSKQQAVKDNAFNTFAMNNATRHQLTDDAITKGLANTQVGVNSPDIISDYSSLQRAPDVAAFEKRVKDINDNRLNNAQEQYKLGPLTQIGNTKQTPISKYKQVDAHTQALDYLNEATVNPEFANVLEHKYPQIYQGAQTEDQYHQAHALASAQLAKDNALYKDMGTTFTKNEAPDNFYAHLRARIAAGDVGGGVIGTPRDLTIPYKDGSARVVAKGYVPINSAALNLAGSPTYDLSNGEKDPQTLSSGDHQLVGVTNVPFITGNYSGTNKAGQAVKSLKGTIAQPEFVAKHPKDIEYRPMLHVQTKSEEGNMEDKLVPYDRLPKNLPKATLKAISGFKPMTGKTQAGTPLDNKHKKAATDYGL